MAYQDNQLHRKKIDSVLHENVKLFQNLGSESTREERLLAKDKEKEALESIKHLDEEKISRLLND